MARSEPAKAAEPRHVMPRPSPCSGKLHFDAYSMVKLVACGVDGNVQSSLPMPRRSRHGSSWLSELPLTHRGRWPNTPGWFGPASSRTARRGGQMPPLKYAHAIPFSVAAWLPEALSKGCLGTLRNRSLKIAKIDQHDGIAAGFEITAAILEIVSKSHKQARYGTEKNVSQMCGTKMNAHL